MPFNYLKITEDLQKFKLIIIGNLKMMMMMFCFNDVKLKSIGGRGLQKYDQWQIKLASNYFSDNFFQVSNNLIFQSPYI